MRNKYAYLVTLAGGLEQSKPYKQPLLRPSLDWLILNMAEPVITPLLKGIRLAYRGFRAMLGAPSHLYKDIAYTAILATITALIAWFI